MKGIVIKTDNTASIEEFGQPLYQAVGTAVGGFIEIVRPTGLTHPIVMIINDNGKIEGLPVNILGCILYGTELHGDPIVGDIVIMQEGFVDGGPDIVGLDDRQADRLLALFNAELARIREELAK